MWECFVRSVPTTLLHAGFHKRVEFLQEGPSWYQVYNILPVLHLLQVLIIYVIYKPRDIITVKNPSFVPIVSELSGLIAILLY